MRVQPGQLAYGTVLTAVPQAPLLATYSPSIQTAFALLGSAAIAG